MGKISWECHLPNNQDYLTSHGKKKNKEKERQFQPNPVMNANEATKRLFVQKQCTGKGRLEASPKLDSEYK